MMGKKEETMVGTMEAVRWGAIRELVAEYQRRRSIYALTHLLVMAGTIEQRRYIRDHLKHTLHLDAEKIVRLLRSSTVLFKLGNHYYTAHFHDDPKQRLLFTGGSRDSEEGEPTFKLWQSVSPADFVQRCEWALRVGHIIVAAHHNAGMKEALSALDPALEESWEMIPRMLRVVVERLLSQDMKDNP